jgi:hypothetical protein
MGVRPARLAGGPVSYCLYHGSCENHGSSVYPANRHTITARRRSSGTTRRSHTFVFSRSRPPGRTASGHGRPAFRSRSQAPRRGRRPRVLARIIRTGPIWMTVSRRCAGRDQHGLSTRCRSCRNFASMVNDDGRGRAASRRAARSAATTGAARGAHHGRPDTTSASGLSRTSSAASRGCRSVCPWSATSV